MMELYHLFIKKGNRNMSISVGKIQDYAKHDLNVLISGLAGTGKTHMIIEAVNNLGLTLKYYSASTLDPYTDLVGIPVPQNETKTVEYYRPRDLDNAEVIFFDELNRADPKTLNTVFELIQFGSINGEKLPKLRSVMAAINPNDGDYTVDELDVALLDRFDVYLESKAYIDIPYFKKKFGTALAMAAAEFWNDYERNRNVSSRSKSNTMAYISPRRMEKIVLNFTLIPNRSTIVESLPPGANTSVAELYKSLTKAMNSDKAEKAKSSSKETKVKKSNVIPISGNVTSSQVDDFIALGTAMRHAKNIKNAEALLSNSSVIIRDKIKLVAAIASNLSNGVDPARLVSTWAFALTEMSDADVRVMTNSWSYQKKLKMNRVVQDSGIAFRTITV